MIPCITCNIVQYSNDCGVSPSSTRASPQSRGAARHQDTFIMTRAVRCAARHLFLHLSALVGCGRSAVHEMCVVPHDNISCEQQHGESYARSPVLPLPLDLLPVGIHAFAGVTVSECIHDTPLPALKQSIPHPPPPVCVPARTSNSGGVPVSARCYTLQGLLHTWLDKDCVHSAGTLLHTFSLKNGLELEDRKSVV